MQNASVIHRAQSNHVFPDSCVGKKPSVDRRGGSFLAEAITFLGKMATRFRERRRFGDVLHIEVAQEIVADAHGVQVRACRAAYTAEQSDREAMNILTKVLADGQVTPEELADIRRAERHILNSARMDKALSDYLAP